VWRWRKRFSPKRRYRSIKLYVVILHMTVNCLKNESVYQLWRRMELPNCGVPILCTVVNKKCSYVSDLLVHRTFFSSSAPWSAALLAFHLNIPPYWSPLSSTRAIPVKGNCWFIRVAYIYSSPLLMNTACKDTIEIAWGCFETYKLSQRWFSPS